MKDRCLEGVSVLLIEDDKECMELLSLVMRNEGASVTCLSEAEPAADELGQTNYDAVALDIMLPGMSGLELLKQVRSNGNNTPVIMITGHGSLDSAVDALQLGAQDYLVKPLVDGSELVNAVYRAVTHHRLEKHNKELQEQLYQSEETERARLGHELHDVLCQDLASIAMITSLIKKDSSGLNDKMKKDIALVDELSCRSLAFAKKLCIGLFPVELESDGLSAALERLAVDHEHIHGVNCSYVENGRVVVDDRSKSLHLYRIAQEAANNAVRSGAAKNIIISLSRNGEHSSLIVEDDGVGVSNDAENDVGMGLHIMKYRSDTLSAEFTIAARESGGTIVTCKWKN